jgi:hypothetical protein
MPSLSRAIELVSGQKRSRKMSLKFRNANKLNILAVICDCRAMTEKGGFPSAQDALAVPVDMFLGLDIQ